jgi:hypothetical protein
MSTAQKAARKGVSRIDPKIADEWFPHRHSLWPREYLPATGVAHFLRKDGVPFQDVVETRVEIQNDRTNAIQRDFASDYGMWLKAELRELELKAKSSSRFARALKRSTNRESLPSLESQCLLWNLVDPASVEHDPSMMPPEEPSPPPTRQLLQQTLPKTEVLSTSTKPYAFRSFASLQEYAVLPTRDVTSPNSLVTFSTFPQLRNCLYTEFDSCSALKAMSLVTGDGLVYTQEFVFALGAYLRSRLDELGESARIDGGLAYRPIVTTFGNGRLAWFLNESRMLPAPVVATQLVKPLMRRVLNFNFDDSTIVSSSIKMEFPCEAIDMPGALEKYKPAIVIAEPHLDRDYTAEMRGYHTVRELIMLGQPDSPAMGSFTYPLLSWGVTPGPHTYWVFNDSLQRASVRGQNLPTDPPYIAQGYRRYYIDDVSKSMIHHNDTPGIQNQSRCVSFRRILPVSQPPRTSSS